MNPPLVSEDADCVKVNEEALFVQFGWNRATSTPEVVESHGIFMFSGGKENG